MTGRSADVQRPSVPPRAAALRRAEFDLLEDDVLVADGASATTGWLETAVAARPRVLRDCTLDIGVHELPTIDTAVRPRAHVDAVVCPPDLDRRGAAAIAWGVAYRDGFAAGRAEGFEQGRDEGLASGEERGRRESLTAGRTAAETALGALDAQIGATLDRLDATADEVAASATDLALQIAELVIERELSLSEDAGADAIRRAARMLPDTGAADLDTLTARLHPADVDRLSAVPSELVVGRSLQIVADGSVAPGSCVLEAGATRVDASIAGSLGRIRAALGLDPRP